jgi:hypothetical protein
MNKQVTKHALFCFIEKFTIELKKVEQKKITWYLCKDVILTEDNLAKHNWHGSLWCCFCHHHETIKILFFQCKFAHSISCFRHVVLQIYLTIGYVEIGEMDTFIPDGGIIYRSAPQP